MMDRRNYCRGLKSRVLFVFATAFLLPEIASAQHCTRMEVLIRKDSPQSQKAMKFMENFQDRWPGLAVEIQDVASDRAAHQRAQQLIKHYGIEKPGVPLIHAAGQLIVGFRDDETMGKQIESLLTVHVYTRDGCPHCTEAKRFLEKIKQRYPGFRIKVYKITRDGGAREDLNALARRHKILAPSVPMFYLCGRVIVGFINDDTTGVQIENLLRESCVACPRGSKSRSFTLETSGRVEMQTSFAPDDGTRAHEQTIEDTASETLLDELPLDDLPEAEADEPVVASAPLSNQPQSMDLPVFGKVSTEHVGLPLFTLAVGLVDGFNPCAMWVLLFLLSILVNLKDRRKILAVAGTFVLISGMAYFAFMAAWLNVFLFVGYLRPAQILLGTMAVFVGGIHIKDFFAHGRGLSFSIPESAKPGIYSRVRRIVTAEHLWGAIIGAAALAVLVNIIELLCTAGLPALYTQILTLQELPTWQNYAYLGLYNLAYMFDDILMVAVVVITLGRRKLQEQHGRWLKLISGVVIALLGVVLLFKPAWLI
jgi:glutaredoxin